MNGDDLLDTEELLARAKHAAKYNAKLIIPAQHYLDLITENETLRGLSTPPGGEQR